ncbi:MAG: helix-turn-helix domain-containing protein [Planctomycetota bacterium]
MLDHLASDLLAEGDRSIAEVAAAVGFRDALYFSRTFRELMGMSPTEYRRAAADSAISKD